MIGLVSATAVGLALRALGVGVALALVPGEADAQAPPARQTASAVFDQDRPGRSTGATVIVDYVNPNDAAAKPYAVHKTITEFAPGTKIDTSVPDRCGASDAELIARGPGACPEASKVGTGEVVLDTGNAGPARTSENNVTIFNNTSELVLLLESKSGPTRFVSRAAIQGTSIVSEVPPIPGGPPDGYTAIKRARLRTNAISRDGRHYATTPETCPVGGWQNTSTFSYRDGVSETVVNASPCVASPQAPTDSSISTDRKPPRIQMFGVKRRGCTHRSFLVRVAVLERESRLSRAELSLDGRRLASTRRGEFSRRIAVRDLAARAHELVATAVDAAGNRRRKAVAFRPCR